MNTDGKTTVKLEPEVAKALKHYIADTDRSWRDQSRVINELILSGIKHKKECVQINGEGNAEASSIST